MFSLPQRHSEQTLELELGRIFILFVLLSLVLILLLVFLVNGGEVEIASDRHVCWTGYWNILFQFLTLLSAYHVALGNSSSFPYH